MTTTTMPITRTKTIPKPYLCYIPISTTKNIARPFMERKLIIIE